MDGGRWLVWGVGVWAGLAFSGAAAGADRVARYGPTASASYASRGATLTWPVPIDTLPAAWREKVDHVLRRPTLSALAPAEEFAAREDVYRWLLDHPDRVAAGWRRLKVPAVVITPLGGGRFGWVDELGSQITWQPIALGPEGRVWYAEGKIRPGPLMPLFPVRAVAVLKHSTRTTEPGRPTIRHQVEVFLQTDSKMASLATRIIGPTGPRMAEEGAESLLAFFSGIARYLEKHPDHTEALLAPAGGQR